MADPQRIPKWLKSLPSAPEYRPTETEFADPIAFISRIEQEAAAFGICKVIPPLPKPSKKFVLSNLTRSFSSSSSSSSTPKTLFTTRHQELGARKGHRRKQQVWQSGEFYTLEQFESKSKTFQRSYLSTFKEVTPLLIESLFWKAAAEKPIYIEYANDVPGSGFTAPEEPFLYRKKRRKFTGEVRNSAEEGTSGCKLSNSPWNLQVIARAPGSLTRFMPDEVPGVTSPMVYVGMLFSWFAWHVEDHELHSLNFLHMGAPKTWYAVPGECASTLEELVRVEAYGGDVDRLEAFTLLGEKTTLLSPEVIVNSGIPCCRLVQNPGEFVVTFPRAYHVGFSHGFNCGEAANFATPRWLKVAKEAAVRRAAMDYLPMLSHQQLLYMLTVSFISRIPRTLLSGVRSSRLKERKKVEREILVKKAFLNDMMNENNLLCTLLSKDSTSYAVLWEPDLLPNPSTVSQSILPSLSFEAPVSAVRNHDGKDRSLRTHEESCSFSEKADHCFVENPPYDITGNRSTLPRRTLPSAETCKNDRHDEIISDVELLEILDTDEDDLPLGLNIDSGTLACVSCGILGYPLMAIVQPTETALRELFSITREESPQNMDKSGVSCRPLCLPGISQKFRLEETDNTVKKPDNPHVICKLSSEQSNMASLRKGTCLRDDIMLLDDDVRVSANMLGEFNPKISISNSCSRDDMKANNFNRVPPYAGLKEPGGSTTVQSNRAAKIELVSARVPDIGAPVKERSAEHLSWVSLDEFCRPRIFCLQHALETEEMLCGKGGAKVLVICHSDYLKIKAYAPSIAEEVGMQFCIKDVPLGNASSAELNLINISIDDAEHEGHAENWTSKLGVNLRHCVKLRKQSTSKQERLSVALYRIFSDPFALSDASTLKWHSKRSRTPYKVVGLTVAKPHTTTYLQKGNVADGNLNTDLATYVKGNCSWKSEPNDMGSKFHHSCSRKGIRTEIFSTDESLTMNGRNGSSSDEHNLNKKNEVDFADGLFTVPVSATEDLQMSQHSWLPLEVSTTDEVTDPDNYNSSSKCKSYTFQESQENALNSESMTSEVGQEVEAVDEINSEHDVYNIVESGAEPTSNRAVDYCRESRDLVAAHDHDLEQEGDFLLPADQAHVTVLSFNNDEMHQEVSISSGPKTKNSVFRSFHSEEQPINNFCTIDSSGMHENEISHFKLASDAEGHSSRSEKQEENLQLAISTSEESTKNESSHSLRHKTLFVSNLSTADTCKVQPEEIHATANNLQDGVNNEQLEVQMCKDGNEVVSSEVQWKNDSTNGKETDTEVSYLKPVVGAGFVSSEHVEETEFDSNKFDLVETCSRNRDSACMIKYVRRTKRKREEETRKSHSSQSDSFIHTKREGENIAEGRRSCNLGFIRGPCEGLRPRTRSTTEKAEAETVARNRAESKTRKLTKDDQQIEPHKCKIEGCCMKFRTSRELHVHKQNRCTYKGCRKIFKSHKHLKRHYQVHDDERPLKCPWKGCSMSFKWGWARTEHIRIHTGERPYKCTIDGCHLTFRYISDFSRHRRKTGHYVNSTEH